MNRDEHNDMITALAGKLTRVVDDMLEAAAFTRALVGSIVVH
jgi:hypothetical protein